MREPIPDAVRAVLDRQAGVITRAQALEHLTRAPVERLVRDGVLCALTHGVYRLAGPAARASQWAWAGHLVGGEASAIGGWAALHLAGVAELPAEVTDVWVPPGTRRRPRAGLRFRVDGTQRLTHTIGTLPLVRLEDAALDVGYELELDAWVGLLSDGVRKH